MKRALITGVTGQDGAYLSELLLSKGYEVYGLSRRVSVPTTERIEGLFQNKNFHMIESDLGDGTGLQRFVGELAPDEIYNLGAMSHVRSSFDCPEYTANVGGLGTLRLLEAIRAHKLEKQTKFYQASTSELYGKVQEVPQKESTPFYPRSPYAIAKLYAYWITVNYREAYGIFACNGILFNHESPYRGTDFVTRKITSSVAKIIAGKQEKLYMGNLDAKRDWGYAKEYVEGMWAMLQHSSPEDYVLATGKAHTVREFIEKAFAHVDIQIAWEGDRGSIQERGVNKATGKTLVEIDPHFFRPTEVDLLLGDASRAHQKLNWKPKTSLDELVKIMVDADMAIFGGRK